MRFALIGIDSDTWQLVEQISGHSEHEIAQAALEPGDAQRLHQLFPQAQISPQWEGLLSGEMVDAVIVSRHANQDLRADQLRKLMQAGVPLIVSHPIQESMLVCYELDMIRQETRCPVLSYSSSRLSPAFERLVALAQDEAESALGELEQVIIERSLAERSPEFVRWAFARDMDMARALAGDLTRLAAMAPSSEPTGYANLGVQLSGPNGALVRWSIAAAEQDAGVQFTLVGSRGRAVMAFRDDTELARLNWSTEASSTTEELSSRGAEKAMARFSSIVRGESVHPDWVDACRAVELADSIQRSLEKGRTVELHYEDYTEAGTFKGTMTSLGCGLLWMSSLVLIVGVIAAGFRLPLADYWPHLVLFALAAFLLLQLLQFAFPNKQSQ